MNLSAKIYSLKHYLKYALLSKGKFKTHSPFVFAFITLILEDKGSEYKRLRDKLNRYYQQNKIQVSTEGNAGEGSQSLGKKKVSASSFSNKVGLPPKYGKVLHGLIRENNIYSVIELGTSLGISTSYLSSHAAVDVTTIEANKQVLDVTRQAYQEIGNSKSIHFVHARFDAILSDLCKAGLANTLIFIDGDHNKEAVMRNFTSCLPFIEESTILVFDDIYWSESMTDSWHEIYQHKKVKLSIDIFRLGIVFFKQANKEKQHFQIWY